MHGATMTKLPRKQKIETIVLTPETATDLLEHNKLNRPLSDPHVHRLAGQIVAGKWRFNGDTIKISETDDVLDGQHRLWAIIEAKVPVETIIVRGIARDAFATIDTLRKPRSGSDVLALCGVPLNRTATATALTWLIRWKRKAIETYKDPKNRVENSDIERAFEENPAIIQAVERVRSLKSIGNRGLLAFLYYIFTNRNPEIADRMLATLEDPAGVGVNDPFFRLRGYLVADTWAKKNAVVTIALSIKAANAAKIGKPIQMLSWKNQGQKPEAFPKLEI